ncbi:MAG TPA: CRTAC1 family protein [Acidobacteriaceae bacterium]|nr:CRTAC1 family protein [Acidobacteriaceae bacterium]
MKPNRIRLGAAALCLALMPLLSQPLSAQMGSAGANTNNHVKQTFMVSGQREALEPLLDMSQDPTWDPTPKAVCEFLQSFSPKPEMESELAPGDNKLLASQGVFNLIMAHHSLGEIDAYLGKMDQAIKQYKMVQALARSNNPNTALQMDEAIGIAYLHKSEMENGIYKKPGNRCLLPMLHSSRYSQSEDSRKAVDYFQQYLTQKPHSLEVRWLLNLAYMTLGQYPKNVPEKYLVPPSVFKSGENLPRFHDVAPQAGLATVSMAGGVIVDDFENNGRLDIVKSSFDSCAPMQYFHNNGDGTFTNVAAKAGLADQLGGLNILQTDYNNDGCLDILVLRGAWEIPEHMSLLRNNCNGTFTDVTKSAGLWAPIRTQTAVWVDINNDGLLDLFVGNENGPARLYLNKGNGKFEDISHAAGVDRIAFTKAVAAGDYDNDGYPDLYVSNLSGRNFLYHNNHNNTFTEVAKSAGVAGPVHSFAAWFFDYNNDGWPDLFVTSYYPSVDETARTYLGLPHNGETLKLYENMHNGTFRDVTKQVGLDKVFMPMGANFGDIDNDGFLDIYLGTGSPSYASEVPNVLLRNNNGKSFVDVTTATGTGDWHKGHGVAFADLANRGYEDIIEVVGGATPGDAHAMRVFENPGNGNDWITLKLVGVKTNHEAIGARIKVTARDGGGPPRSIDRTVGSGGSFGASPLQQHIGLGKNAKIVSLDIWWPTSNTRQHFTNVMTNQFLQIKEFSKKYVRLERKPYTLGGKSRAQEPQ